AACSATPSPPTCARRAPRSACARRWGCRSWCATTPSSSSSRSRPSSRCAAPRRRRRAATLSTPMARSDCATIRNSRAPLAAALVATLLALPACLTIRQGDLLRARLADCARSVDRIERFGKEHDAEVAELRKVLDQATALLASNDDDIVTREGQVEAD